MNSRIPFAGLVLLLGAAPVAALAQAPLDRIVSSLKEISPHVAAETERDALRGMLGRSLRERIAAANRASTSAWGEIHTREDWERFRAEKLRALKNSLGELPERTKPRRTLVTGRFTGDGFEIQILAYESRPGLVVTANLYVPDPPRASMPGILLSHSHHNPKHEGELQDMGMTWARAGCYVLVPDHLGHGERRQHPFESAADFAGSFQPGRQDYYFRYDTSLQLYLVGQTLMGWMVHDLMTGVDQLLAQPGIDPERIALLGSVAGGGDPAAVTAALDERIACVVPFNSGGPQPESRFPLPADAESSFNYAGSGSWESTRNLYRSAGDGFLPWTIVASVAPRFLIHAHEFAWDRERDPVWKRYKAIWNLYQSRERLAFAHGHGTLTGQSPPGSHCNNIGAVHRRQIHEAFREWLKIDVKPEHEYKNRRPREQLRCLTEEAREHFQPQPLHAILASIADRQLRTATQSRAIETPDHRRRLARQCWTRLLSSPEPPERVEVRAGTPQQETRGDLTIRREFLATAAGIEVPLLVVIPAATSQRVAYPLVVHLAADGIRGILERRIDELAALLQEGNAIAIVEPCGMGASAPSSDQGQQGSITGQSATELMLGRTLLGEQLCDLRASWRHLASLPEIDRTRMSIRGDSPVGPLQGETTFSYPRRIEQRPREPLPQAALLALLCALCEDNVAAVEASGSLTTFRSVLESPFAQLPHAGTIPGVLRETDIPQLVAALAPCQVTLRSLVDGRGESVPVKRVREAYTVAIDAYSAAGAGGKLRFAER